MILVPIFSQYKCKLRIEYKPTSAVQAMSVPWAGGNFESVDSKLRAGFTGCTPLLDNCLALGKFLYSSSLRFPSINESDDGTNSLEPRPRYTRCELDGQTGTQTFAQCVEQRRSSAGMNCHP